MHLPKVYSFEGGRTLSLSSQIGAVAALLLSTEWRMVSGKTGAQGGGPNQGHPRVGAVVDRWE